jgi:DNA ligase-1
MDIRNFFGGGKQKPTTADADRKEETERKPAKSRKIICDDEDEEGHDTGKEGKENSASSDSKAAAATSSGGEPNQTKTSSDRVGNEAKDDTNSKDEPKDTSAKKIGGIGVKSGNEGDATREMPKDVSSLITWKEGENVPFSALVETFDKISNVSGRLEKEGLFIKLYRAIMASSPKDLDTAVYLSSNSVAPAYEVSTEMLQLSHSM